MTNSAPGGEKIDPVGADGAEGEMVSGGRAAASPLQSSSNEGGALQQCCPAAAAAAEVVPGSGGARQRWCRRGGARAREEIPATVLPLEEGLGARCRRGRRRRWRMAAAALEP